MTSASAAAQAPVAGAPVALRVLKISAGPAGAEKSGVFTLLEERSIFSRSADREVIVLFEWEGTPGLHKMVATWRSPDGAVSSTATIDYVARDRRFGAYWPLYLSSGIALGTWSVEATVDGQPAGRYTFEIRDEKVESPVVRKRLTASEAYELLNRVFVVIERAGPGGKPLDPAAGFALSAGRVYTTMSALDSADSLHAIVGGARKTLDAVYASSRRDDWAILVAPDIPGSPMEVAAPDGVKIGDRLFTMDGSSTGSRMLRDGTLSGHVEKTGAGRRLLASFVEGTGSAGAPVIDECGALVGVIGGPPVAGANRLGDLLRLRAELRGHAVIPFGAVRQPGTAPARPLAELRASGDIVPPLQGEGHVVAGGFARGVSKSPPGPVGQSEDFSLGDKSYVTLVNFMPRERLRGTLQVLVHDASNTLVMQTKTEKWDGRKNDYRMTWWELPVPRSPGVYRVDVLFTDTPIWRGFVRINP